MSDSSLDKISETVLNGLLQSRDIAWMNVERTSINGTSLTRVELTPTLPNGQYLRVSISLDQQLLHGETESINFWLSVNKTLRDLADSISMRLSMVTKPPADRPCTILDFSSKTNRARGITKFKTIKGGKIRGEQLDGAYIGQYPIKD